MKPKPDQTVDSYLKDLGVNDVGVRRRILARSCVGGPARKVGELSDVQQRRLIATLKGER